MNEPRADIIWHLTADRLSSHETSLDYGQLRSSALAPVSKITCPIITFHVTQLTG